MKFAFSDLDNMADQFRSKELGISPKDAIDPFLWTVSGVKVRKFRSIKFIDAETKSYLSGPASSSWSAMSIPLDENKGLWYIVINDKHSTERQKISLLEEFWHIFLGHNVTKIYKVGDTFGRSYESQEEHDAYYIAAATLVPKNELIKLVHAKKTSAEIAGQYGVSSELVEYRIKRLGYWRAYLGKRIKVRKKSDDVFA